MTALSDYLSKTAGRVAEYFAAHPVRRLEPEELQKGTFAYFLRGGKRLRPALLCLAAGALGGEEKEIAAIPAALGVEFYHTWTLIHDDVIDHDDTRRGKASVHAEVFRDFASYGEKGREYAVDTAILAGDALHSAAIFYVASLEGVDPRVPAAILRALEGDYGLRLISGEAIDTRNGLLYSGSFWEIPEEDVLAMISGKTAALFGISALAGAMIGQDSPVFTPAARALADFAENCGMAFQLQDDVLGLLADEEKLGKPVLSDLREGKATPLLLRGYRNASAEEQAFLRRVIGVSENKEELAEARRILIDRGGAAYAEHLAEEYLSRAEKALSLLPDSTQKDLLGNWCAAMVRRDR